MVSRTELGNFKDACAFCNYFGISNFLPFFLPRLHVVLCVAVFPSHVQGWSCEEEKFHVWNHTHRGQVRRNLGIVKLRMRGDSRAIYTDARKGKERQEKRCLCVALYMPTHLPNQQRTLNKLTTWALMQKTLSIINNWACKSVPNVHGTCTCSNRASILHTTVAGWVLLLLVGRRRRRSITSPLRLHEVPYRVLLRKCGKVHEMQVTRCSQKKFFCVCDTSAQTFDTTSPSPFF